MDAWQRLGLAARLGGGHSRRLVPLWLLLACLRPGAGLEHISYVPQLANATLAGRLTQTTFTLEQPRGQFSHLSISDWDPIWLVVANSCATQDFTTPKRTKDLPVPAQLSQRGYYVTLRASRALYPPRQPHRLQVLRVGNDSRCSPEDLGCNSPLRDPGPYRVKFLVMRNDVPVAETDWSEELRLQRAETLEIIPGSQSPRTVVIITLLAVLLAVFLTTLLALLVHTW
ncbi:uroplakin-3b-like protein 1 [Sorex araneus]|uniref:uroplakin-3b-like protein 1 n=1 Tax=Sorex araneus TaxID=42254 RepID=UPI0024333FE9|nr:uroplakin-3b-like protein 1 [Sorex araneus]